MKIDPKQIVAQLDDVLSEFEKIRPNRKQNADNNFYYDVSRDQIVRYLSRAHAAIKRLDYPNSSYSKSLPQLDFSQSLYANSEFCDYYAGLLLALKADYEGGFFESLPELIHADVFNDFIEMAEHLMEQNYKDPAAVIAGSVLEEHLRKLCGKHGISVAQPDGRPKKAETMNTELAGANVYAKLDQKSVTGWLDLRNKAAHGKYSEYVKGQVDLLIKGVRDFITRNPA